MQFFVAPRRRSIVRAYRIAYDGTDYHGFQRQPDVPTVEGTLLDALSDLGVLEGADTPPRYAAAGRTDAGVSALAQTVAFDAPAWLSPAALNSELPAAVRAWASADVRPDFHATHHARSREYTYFLFGPHADESRVRAALEALSGERDFHNLTPDGSGTRRRLSTTLSRDGPFLVIRFRAGGFPRQLVRRAVSLVASVARGERTVDEIERILGPEPLLGPDGIQPAAPEPLVLSDVSYDVQFTPDDEAVRSTRGSFRRRYVERAGRARVAERILEGL